jgi:hypothetical protein
MRWTIAFLVMLLAALVILATTMYTTTKPIESILNEYQQVWPGQQSDLADCFHYNPFHHSQRPVYECRLSDSAHYISNGTTITALRLDVHHVRIGDGIEAYGPPDFHLHNDDFHFMKWESPPLTMVAHHVRGAWLMGVVNEVYLRG